MTVLRIVSNLEAADPAALAAWRRRMAGLGAACRAFSVRQLVVAVTKLDLVGFDEAVYQRAAAVAEGSF